MLKTQFCFRYGDQAQHSGPETHPCPKDEGCEYIQDLIDGPHVTPKIYTPYHMHNKHNAFARVSLVYANLYTTDTPPEISY
jgi:hypothetical protein